jgi:hypothetical protein
MMENCCRGSIWEDRIAFELIVGPLSNEKLEEENPYDGGVINIWGLVAGDEVPKKKGDGEHEFGGCGMSLI